LIQKDFPQKNINVIEAADFIKKFENMQTTSPII